jgi:hypothetical protein
MMSGRLVGSSMSERFLAPVFVVPPLGGQHDGNQSHDGKVLPPKGGTTNGCADYEALLPHTYRRLCHRAAKMAPTEIGAI